MGAAPRRLEAWLALVAVPLAAGIATLLVVIGATAALGGGPAPAAGPIRTTIDVPPLLPGAAARHCRAIAIAPGGGAPVEVRLTAAVTGPLAPHLHLAVHRGEAGSTCARPGRLTPLAAGRAADGAVRVTDRTALPGTTVVYAFEVTLEAGAPDEAQGAHATLDASWEVIVGGEAPG